MPDVDIVSTHYLTTLTALIDNINDEPRITAEFLHTTLWSLMHQLRTDPKREALLLEWKYKTDFLSTEEYHQNEQQTCPQLKWEQSYVMFFYLCIYHWPKIVKCKLTTIC